MMTSETNTEPLQLVLTGGGVKCAYQGTFIEKLYQSKFANKYHFETVYGTSFGAISGLFITIKRFDLLHKFYDGLNKTSLAPWFSMWGLGRYLKMIPILGPIFGLIIDVIWLSIAMKKKSLYSPKYGIDFLNKVDLNKYTEQLKKFYCCVYNVSKNKYQYIQGTHPFIKKYVLASCSLWILFPPVYIPQFRTECECNDSCDCSDNTNNLCNCSNPQHRENEYIDGGLTRFIPIEFVDHKNYLVLATKPIHDIKNRNFFFDHTGDHLFDYLDRLTTFVINRNLHYELTYCHEWHSHDNVKIINYKGNSDIADVSRTNILQVKSDGTNLATQYLNEK